MLRVISAVNVNSAFRDAFFWLKAAGQREESRNGGVIVAPGPVVTEYFRPQERVLFNEKRDCNHVFHLMEAIWMLGGQNKIDFLLPFNSKFGQYAETNGKVHGAYGYRWRNAFGNDQIIEVVAELTENPNSRRAVMAMWDPDKDLGADKRDLPCNTHIYFDLRDDKLNMTVCNRSNDILWGCYGANVVHMSMLQELIACWLKKPMGMYRQFSNNFHAYSDNAQVAEFLLSPPMDEDWYSRKEPIGDGVVPYPLIDYGKGDNPLLFLDECTKFCENPDFKPTSSFLYEIARPLRSIYLSRKAGVTGWRDVLYAMPSHNDWVVATRQWCDRRNP